MNVNDIIEDQNQKYEENIDQIIEEHKNRVGVNIEDLSEGSLKSFTSDEED